MPAISEGEFVFSGSDGLARCLRLLSTGQESGHLALVLPGRGYTPDMPALFFPSRVMLAHGLDVLNMDYRFTAGEGETLDLAGRVEQACASSEAALKAVLEQKAPERLTLIGKSLGTFVMAHLINCCIDLPRVDCIWITPILKEEQLREQMERVQHMSLVIAGGADTYSDEKTLDRLQKTAGMHTLVIENADHALEVPGNVSATLRGLERMVHGIEGFMGWSDFRRQWGLGMQI